MIKYNYISIIVQSQVNCIVQPTRAESYHFPNQIRNECQDLANSLNLPVVCLGRNTERETFEPQTKKNKRVKFYYAKAPNNEPMFQPFTEFHVNEANPHLFNLTHSGIQQEAAEFLIKKWNANSFGYYYWL
jgi:hypothetical protein